MHGRLQGQAVFYVHDITHGFFRVVMFTTGAIATYEGILPRNERITNYFCRIGKTTGNKAADFNTSLTSSIGPSG